MSKKLNLGLGVLDYSSIHWFHADNGRKVSYGDPLSDLGFEIKGGEKEGDERRVTGRTGDGLVYKLYSGWDSSQGIVKVGTLEHLAELQSTTVEALTEKAIAEREEMIIAWENTDDYKALSVIARRVYFPGGKPAPILAFGNECFRRSLGVMGAIYKRSLPPLHKELSFEIPVMVKMWTDETARIKDHLMENTGKDEGRAKLDTLDFLNTAFLLYRASPVTAKESDLAEAGVKRGMAQKLFRYVKLDAKHRAVKLVDRCFLPRPTQAIATYAPDCHIPIGSVDKEEVQRLLKGIVPSDSTGTKRLHKDGSTNDKDVHSWLKGVVVGSGEPTRKAFTAAQIAKIADESPVRAVQKIARAIAEGREEVIALLNEHADEVNAALDFLYPAESDDSAEVDVEQEANA